MRFELKEIHGDWFLLGEQEEVTGGAWKGQIMFDPNLVNGERPSGDILAAGKDRLREMRRNGIWK